MIIGNLANKSRIESLHPLFKTLFDKVECTDFDKLPLGKVEVKGDDLFIMNLHIDGADIEKQPLEMHREYIDVHIVLDGEEQIGWKAIEDIEHYTKEYAADGDCALSDDKPSFFARLTKGQFCIVYPEDPHAPAISNGKIRKLIGKVKVNY
jgi:YhcH/YjgK/YiaL family protein